MKLQAVVTDLALHEFGLPQRSTPGSAGLDLRAMIEPSYKILQPGKQIQVSTGLKVWIKDPAWVGLVFARSGLGVKGLVLANGTGVIDADYQGPLLLTLLNRSGAPIQINRGDRVAQLVMVPCAATEIEVVEAFDAATDRAAGGHGSTGAA